MLIKSRDLRGVGTEVVGRDMQDDGGGSGTFIKNKKNVM